MRKILMLLAIAALVSCKKNGDLCQTCDVGGYNADGELKRKVPEEKRCDLTDEQAEKWEKTLYYTKEVDGEMLNYKPYCKLSLE